MGMCHCRILIELIISSSIPRNVVSVRNGRVLDEVLVVADAFNYSKQHTYIYYIVSRDSRIHDYFSIRTIYHQQVTLHQQCRE